MTNYRCENCSYATKGSRAYCPNCHSRLNETEESLGVETQESNVETPEDSMDLETKTEEDQFECEIEGCDRSFDTERGRASHQGQVHNEEME